MPHPIFKKIGHVQTMFVLSILYFLIGGITAFFMKIFRHNPLKLKCVNGSYWRERKQKTCTLENYYNQF